MTWNDTALQSVPLAFKKRLAGCGIPLELIKLQRVVDSVATGAGASNVIIPACGSTECVQPPRL